MSFSEVPPACILLSRHFLRVVVQQSYVEALQSVVSILSSMGVLSLFIPFSPGWKRNVFHTISNFGDAKGVRAQRPPTRCMASTPLDRASVVGFG